MFAAGFTSQKFQRGKMRRAMQPPGDDCLTIQVAAFSASAMKADCVAS
jgi:hypothetical protein